MGRVVQNNVYLHDAIQQNIMAPKDPEPVFLVVCNPSMNEL
jgi:hypothetical protein